MALIADRRILLVIGGGIAAYKALDLARRLRERGAVVRAVLTRSGRRFVTPLSVAAITGERVFTDLFDPDDEHQIGHIRLSRDADLIVVAPATADLLARMAQGLADDLATAVLLATDRPVLAAPAMNPRMWSHPATRRNCAQLAADGVAFVGPVSGEMAESGEAGMGRLAEPLEIVAAVERMLAPAVGDLSGRRAIVTSGPTYEPIDPVRYIANRSSGRQGHAIAAALARAGADVTLVSGPVEIPPPFGVSVVAVETAAQMRDAVWAALPADIAVMAAAVADWRAAGAAAQKIKKGEIGSEVSLRLAENPDILAGLARHERRPKLLIGFAAETEDLLANASEKLKRKGCDWIVANDVSPEHGVMGGKRNRVHLLTSAGVEDWPEMGKQEVAQRLVQQIAASFAEPRPAYSEPAASSQSIPETEASQERESLDAAIIPPAPTPVATSGDEETAPPPDGVGSAALDIRPER